MEEIILATGTKEEKYESLFPQLEALWAGEDDLIANMANTVAAIKQVFDFHWVGFYFVKESDLVLGPFQGPIACTRIPFGKGVCGKAWEEGQTILVPDVELFPGHIACSALSRSEIVVPVFGLQTGFVESLESAASIIAVLDIDSAIVNDFDLTDKRWLEKICQKMAS